MKLFGLNVVLCSSAISVALGISYQMDYSGETTPVGKVVQLMQNMVAQGEKDMQEEKIQFATYSQWCTLTKEKKTQVIAQTADAIESIKADVAKSTATIERLTAEITGHQEEIERLVLEQDNMTQVRSKENADFKAEQKDYEESIDALGRALSTLQKQAYDREQAGSKKEALLDMPVSGCHREVKEAIAAFISRKPEVDGYEFQSQGLITMLSEFKDKFVLEKAELEKLEFEKKAAAEQTLAGLKDEQEAAQKATDKKAALKSKKLQQKAKLQENLETTKTTKASDEDYLKETTATCDQKAADFEARQKLRVEELETVNKAIDVMSSASVSGTEKKQLAKSFIQVGRATSLAALRSHKVDKDLKAKLLGFLQSEAERLHSKVLAKLVAPTAVSEAMENIRDTLEGVIKKLEAVAADEHTKREYCKKEIKKNKATRADKRAAIDELEADIDMLEASVKQLTEEVAALGDDLVALDQSVANATDIRGKEKAKNNETVTDAKAAQAAVTQALAMLKEFYEKAGQATALVQTSAAQVSDQPAIFDAPYQGMGGQSGGVLGLLEVIAADFARLEAETSSEEEAGQTEYENFLKESRLNKKQMELDVKHKKETSAEQTAEIQEKSNELLEVQEELAAALKVWEVLQKECLTSQKAEEERREENIESLKKALDMLADS